MIPHHQEAVDTAGRIAGDTERGELREFTAEMARVQSNEIEMMEAWLREWYGVSPGGHMMGRRMWQAPGCVRARPVITGKQILNNLIRGKEEA